MKMKQHNIFDGPKVNKTYAVILMEEIEWHDQKRVSVYLYPTFEEAKDFFETYSCKPLAEYTDINRHGVYKTAHINNTTVIFAGYTFDYTKIPMQIMMDI